MTTATLLHAATQLEAVTTRGKRFRRPGEMSDDYWQGADDAVEVLLAHLRRDPDQLAATSARILRLRELAQRASGGHWRVDRDETTLLTDDGRLGKLVPGAATYIAATQPSTVIAILDAFEDPEAPLPDVSSMRAVIRTLPRTPWTYTGCFIRDRAGVDIGWLQRSHDIDFVAHATPQFLGTLARTATVIRGA